MKIEQGGIKLLTVAIALATVTGIGFIFFGSLDSVEPAANTLGEQTQNEEETAEEASLESRESSANINEQDIDVPEECSTEVTESTDESENSATNSASSDIECEIESDDGSSSTSIRSSTNQSATSGNSSSGQSGSASNSNDTDIQVNQ